MNNQRKVRDAVSAVLTFAGMGLVLHYLVFPYLIPKIHQILDPDQKTHEQARIKAESNLGRTRRLRARKREAGEAGQDGHESAAVEDLALNQYESQIAMEVVAPEDIPVGFGDIGGLEEIIEEIREAVIYPLTMPHLYSHGGALLSAPSGVLLYGPPGCGKTMLAKAVAHESGASFINLHISTLTEKWYGDSNKLVRAVFSLARKLQPAIIFIDEIDAVLGTRRNDEHEASGMVKAEFMTLWDGLTSANETGVPARIVVLGATNRINSIDEAILRRLPKKFPVSLPAKDERRRILELLLRGTKKDADFDLDFIAKVTGGLSGSDIKEACRDAAMVAMRECIRQHTRSGAPVSKIDPHHIRGIKTADFFGRPGGPPASKRLCRRRSSGDGLEGLPSESKPAALDRSQG